MFLRFALGLIFRPGQKYDKLVELLGLYAFIESYALNATLLKIDYRGPDHLA